MSGRRATFRLEAIHPSLNTWTRQHPMKVARMKQEYGWFVRVAVQNAIAHQTWDGRMFDRARLTVRYHFPNNNRRDADNYASKFFNDGLVTLGVLRDDDFDHLELHIERGENAKPGWTELIVEEVAE